MKLTADDLMNADPLTLTPEQIAMRRELVKLKTEEIALEKTRFENQKYIEEKLARENKAKAGRESHEAFLQKQRDEQAACWHKTGGSGLGGFFAGDGAVYGSATAGLELPTGELYFLCVRCQREWHHPKWPKLWPDGKERTGMRAVLDGLMTLAEYRQQEADFIAMMRQPRKSFEPLNGEFCAASKFFIPALENQMRKDKSEFEQFCKGKK